MICPFCTAPVFALIFHSSFFWAPGTKSSSFSLKPPSTWTQHSWLLHRCKHKALSSYQVLSSLETSISLRKKPLLISLSVIEACRECSIAYLSGADPINHSTLHHFRCVLAVHLPYSEHPRGTVHPCYHPGFCSPGAVSNCQSVVMSVCYLTVFPSLCALSQSRPLCPLSFLSVFFIFFLHRGNHGCLLYLACADAHGAASVWECDHFNNPSFTFLSCFFPFQCNGQVETCFSDTLTMDSVAMVFCNRSNGNASCLLWKPGRKTGLTPLIKKCERCRCVCACKGECCGHYLVGERNCCRVWILTLKMTRAKLSYKDRTNHFKFSLFLYGIEKH